MREIKCKIWDAHTNMMLFPDINDGLFYSRFGKYYLDGFANIRDSISGKIPDKMVLQYATGLKDMNGMKIYEGDILKYHTGSGTLRKVIFKNAAFHSVTLDEKPGSPNHPLYFQTLAPDGTDGIEVVGHILENPELIQSPLNKGYIT